MTTQGGNGGAPRLGSMFGRYRIDSIVGRGGMGVVLRATDTELGRPVALKFVAPELSDDASARERFIRESRLAAAIEHPNIVPIYEAGESDGTLFIAMRAIPGSDLATILRREAPLAFGRTHRLAVQLADALDTAHRRGLIHRDVKPGNVLVEPGEDDRPERAWLTDFGLTRRMGDGSAATASRPVGSIDFLAPEMIDGGAIGAWTDQYSLACLIVQCLTGSPPWEGTTDAAVLWAHLHADRDALADRLGDRTRAAVIARALSVRPADRWVDCRTFIGALGDEPSADTVSPGAVQGPPRGSAPDPANPALVRRPAHRRPRALRSVGLGGLLSVGAVFGVGLAFPPPTIPPDDTGLVSPATGPIVLGGPDGVLVFAGGTRGQLDLWAVLPNGDGLRQITRMEGSERWPTVTPDGRNLIFTAGPHRSRDLWMLDLLTGDLRPLTRGSSDEYASAISPDGLRLAYVSDRAGSDDIWLMEDTGSGFVEAEAINLMVAGTDANHEDVYPAWDPDGKRLVFASNRFESSDIWRVDIDRPSKVQALTLDVLPFRDISPTVGPGSVVAFVGRRGHEDREIYLLPRDGSPERLTSLGDHAMWPEYSPDGTRIAIALGQTDEDPEPIAARLTILDARTGAKRSVVPLGFRVATDAHWIRSLTLGVAEPHPTQAAPVD